MGRHRGGPVACALPRGSSRLCTWQATQHTRQNDQAKGGHRRPFGSLCYPVISERLPSGTLRNKAAKQATRAILLGYSGGRSGDFEAIGVARSQPGYICYLPDSNSTIVTNDVYICWKIQPGLQRSSAVSRASRAFSRSSSSSDEKGMRDEGIVHRPPDERSRPG